MSSILTFCTADVQPALIKKLIKDSQRMEGGQFKTWSIVRSPDQANLGKLTKTSIKPFQTGFKNASQENLAGFVRSRPKQTGPHSFCRTVFAALDERSVRDETMLLYVYIVYMPEEFQEEEFDETRAIKEWRELRVEFSRSAWIAGILEVKPYLFTLEYDDIDEYIDENGIFHEPDDPEKEGEVEVESDSTDSEEE